MIQSMNTKADLVMEAIFHNANSAYGKIMIGDRGFEFYQDRDVRRFVQIAWQEVDYVSALVLFQGKWIPRFYIHNKKNGMYSFSAKHVKKVLKMMETYIPKEKMVQEKSLFHIVKEHYRFELVFYFYQNI